jgi:two-component system, chemotaxis family, protein-glutamate methylesterase/glutaminase
VGIKQLVVIGASAGGLEAVREIVAALPAGFPTAICVVLHTASESPGVVGPILDRSGRLPATNARNGERLQPGHIYVAPPDCHLLVEPGIIRVTKGPRENRFRPAIDPLFRSAAQVYGPAAIGVILTGSLDDGTAGLWAIKRLGGTAIVQDPDEAMYPAMPRSALAHVQVDHVVRLQEIVPLLIRLTSAPAEGRARLPVPETLEVEVKIAKEHHPLDAGLEDVTEPSMFACPECHGVLQQLKEGERVRFRCHTGHAYSSDSLLAAIAEGTEHSLWNAIRALEEADLLMRRMAAHVKASHGAELAEQLLVRAEQTRQQSDVVRKLVTDFDPITPES